MIDAITDFNKAAGNTTDRFNVRQSALYLGLQCEELAEKLDAIGIDSSALSTLGTKLKRGSFDIAVRHGSRKEMLDADMDLVVVSIGAALSQGADVAGAMAEVIRSNESKKVNGELHKDVNGKIVKGPNYSAPDLAPFLCR